ncbi:MAG TPA: peptidoglycan-binding protein [Bradyrhizobium sp.]|nr:peptidoglycan-binding protein [Bradyrhizobium sp.]
MPKRIVDEDETPPRRRRRSAKAVAIEAEPERGLAMRVLLYSPKDTVAGLLAFAAVTAIITNALFLQVGPHPSPMFGSVVVIPAAAPPSSSASSPASSPAPSLPVPPSASPMPRPRPVEASPPEPGPVELKSSEAKPDLKAEAKALDVKPPEVRAVEPKTPDSMTSLVKAATASMPATTSTVLRPPAPIPGVHNNNGLVPGGSRRIAAVQRALTEFGYGQLRPSGVEGPDTKLALARFERERRLPVTAQISDRLIRELSAMTGRPIQ